jgi:hypothetical protein
MRYSIRFLVFLSIIIFTMNCTNETESISNKIKLDPEEYHTVIQKDSVLIIDGNEYYKSNKPVQDKSLKVVSLVFKKNVSKENAIRLLKSYKLDFHKEPGYKLSKVPHAGHPIYTIDIDEGYEYQWATHMKENPNISIAYAWGVCAIGNLEE